MLERGSSRPALLSANPPETAPHSAQRASPLPPFVRSDDVDDQHTERGRGLLRKEAEAAASGAAVGDVLHSGVIDLEFPGLGPKRERIDRLALINLWQGGNRGCYAAPGLLCCCAACVCIVRLPFGSPFSPLFVLHPIGTIAVTRKRSWFNFRAPRPEPEPGRDGAGGGGAGSSGSAGRTERAPLFSGTRSDSAGAGGGASGGLFASLLRNKFTTNSSPVGSSAEHELAHTNSGGDAGGGVSSSGVLGGGGGSSSGAQASGLDSIFAELTPARTGSGSARRGAR